jgi:predicted kinase
MSVMSAPKPTRQSECSAVPFLGIRLKRARADNPNSSDPQSALRVLQGTGAITSTAVRTRERSRVLILTGAPGSGKTTVAQLLAASSRRAVHLESDRFFRFIQAGYIEPWRPEAHEQNTVVMGVVGEAASAYAAAGYFTIIDGIISPRWFLKPLRDSLGASGHLVSYAVLRAPLETCLSRAANRASDRLSNAAVIERLWRDFANLESLEGHAVDSGTQTASAVADVLEQRSHAGLLLV